MFISLHWASDIYTCFRMQSIGMAGVPTSDIYSDRPIFSLQGKS